MDKAQVQLARKTGKSQVTVSRLERQSDMLISTPNEVVRGLGGSIRIVAELPDRPPVYLTGLADLSADTGGKASARTRVSKAKPEVGRPRKRRTNQYTLGAKRRIMSQS